MNCRDCESLLLDRLDGPPGDLPTAAAEHLIGCENCRELSQAGRLLGDGLRSTPAPVPPADLGRRIVRRVLADRRAQRLQRYRVTVGLAAAAAILLLVLPVLHRFFAPAVSPVPEPPHQIVEQKPAPPSEKPEKPAPSLQNSVAEAGQAMVNLTGRLADETQKQAKRLLAAAPTDLPPMGISTDPDTSLDPVRQSMESVTTNVSTGLQSVANTTQHAVSYFSRELPIFGAKKKDQ